MFITNQSFDKESFTNLDILLFVSFYFILFYFVLYFRMLMTLMLVVVVAAAAVGLTSGGNQSYKFLA